MSRENNTLIILTLMKLRAYNRGVTLPICAMIKVEWAVISPKLCSVKN